MEKYDVIVVGGGASGMMAAGRAAETGCRVLLLEKMQRLGSKLAITGKGRCNITNMEELESFLLHYGANGKFLHNCYARFFNEDLIDFLETKGMAIVVERGKRVFPAHDDAESIVRCLHDYLKKNGVEVRTGFKVDEILVSDEFAAGVQGDGIDIPGESVIVSTGGLSYPLTGSTGDGYRFAMDLGHRVRKPEPNLVPVEIEEDFVTTLQGLSLKNIELTAFVSGRRFSRLFGEMLFTHFGISGPIVLTMSREVVKMLSGNRVTLLINFKPALTKAQLEQRLLREFSQYGKMKYKNVLKHLLPIKLVDVFVGVSGISADKPVCEINRLERQRIIQFLNSFPLTVKGVRPIDEAIVTDGGIALDEIDPLTMQSRVVKGLFFCGEVIDIAGDTGGYNLQAAFSTGYVAGESACCIRKERV
ncbi:MAG: NAD(P)/FAD-dependent oxidoreductase [bacterium]